MFLIGWAFLFRLLFIYGEWRWCATAGCYALILLTLLSFLACAMSTRLPAPFYRFEALLLILVIVFAIYHYLSLWIPEIRMGPRNDIGRTTMYAAQSLFLDLENPYRSTGMTVAYQDPYYSGYKFGPAMIYGYALSAFMPAGGSKITNLCYLSVAGILLCFLAWDRQKPRLMNTATSLFVLSALFVPDRMWYELLFIGVNDIFPAVLILAALLCIKRENWFLSGLLTGLVFSAKAGYALPLALLLIRKDLKRSYFTGFAAGLVPLALFFLWDARALWDNYFLFHLQKAYNDSSLYSVVPVSWHFLFPLGQLAAILYVMRKNFAKTIDFQELTVQYLFLLIVLQLLYKELHGNHPIFYIPLISLVIGWHRHLVLSPLMFFARSKKAPASDAPQK